MQSALNILGRRLQPRGLWPVVRVPRAQVDQLRLFNWMRRYEDIFSQTFEHHMATPLQPTEFPGRGQYGQLVAQQEPDRARSRTPPRAQPTHNPASPESEEEESEPAGDDALGDAPGSAASSDLPPLHVAMEVAEMTGMQEVLQGQLQGIWREDDETEMELSASTSTSTTTSTSSTTSWTSLWTRTTSMQASPTTSTTSTTSQSPTPAELVRNATARELVYANTADVIDMVHRLLARSRILLRNQRLLCEAVEEALLWFPTPPLAPTLNAPTMDARLWGVVANAATTGEASSGPSSSSLHPAEPEAVLLQPGLPATVEEIEQNLPDLPRRTIVGLRRRVWQQHVRGLYSTAGVEIAPSSRRSSTPDLYLLQVNESVEVPVPAGHTPLPRPPRRGQPYMRRRHRAPRPPPRPLRLHNGHAQNLQGGRSVVSLPGLEAAAGVAGGEVSAGSADGLGPSVPLPDHLPSFGAGGMVPELSSEMVGTLPSEHGESFVSREPVRRPESSRNRSRSRDG